MNLENDLRASFARHEHLTPPATPLLARIMEAATRRRRRRGRLTAAAIAVALLSMIAVPATWAGGLFHASGADDPGSGTKGAPVNVLVIGSDRTPTTGSPRADMVMLAHLPADRETGYLVSIPRWLWVDDERLNLHYADGGVAQLRRVVERMTGVRFDATVEVEFAGLVSVVDALDGVDLCIETPKGTDSFRSVHKPFRLFTKGCRHYDGAVALDYVRQRYHFPDGDHARMRHQQDLVRAILDRLGKTGALRRPGKLLDAARDALKIHGDLDLAATASQLSGLTGEDLTGVRAPTTLAIRDGGSVAQPVMADYHSLWAHLRDGDLATWVKRHPRWVND